MRQSKRPYTIVITGSIGTGKSAAAACLRDLGYTVLDSDSIVHEGYESGGSLNEAVVSRFGSGIVETDGRINRQMLGNMVFGDEKLLSELNSIVHAYVVGALMSDVDSAAKGPVFLDIPLMIEEKGNLEAMGLRYDEIWLIYADEAVQRERLKLRAISEGKDPDSVLAIIGRQIAVTDKIPICTRVIDNSSTLNNLNNQISSILFSIGKRK